MYGFLKNIMLSKILSHPYRLLLKNPILNQCDEGAKQFECILETSLRMCCLWSCIYQRQYFIFDNLDFIITH